MQGTSNHTLIGGVDDSTGRNYVFYEVPVGGSGGFVEHDGSSVFGTVDWADNQPILPAEAIEVHFSTGSRARGDPHRFMRPRAPTRRVRPPTRDQGPQPAGNVSRWCRTGPSCRRSACSEAPTANPTPTVSGQTARSSPSPRRARASGVPLSRDDVVIARTAGGGGYGAPYEREPELVAADVADGFLSAAVARDMYGVAVSNAGDLDAKATESLRMTAQPGWHDLTVVGEHESCVGDLGRHRVFRIHSKERGIYGSARR